MRCGWYVFAFLVASLLVIPLSYAVVNSDCPRLLAMGLPCVVSSTPTGGVGVGGSSPPPSGGVSPTPTGPNASCQLSSNYGSCIQTCDQNFGPDDNESLKGWTECRNFCNKNYGTCTGTCPSSDESCQPNTETVTTQNPVTGFTYSIENVTSCGCGPVSTPPVSPGQPRCNLSSSYSACLQNCSAKSGDDAFACYKNCANSYSFEPAGSPAAPSVCNGYVCKDTSGKPLSGYCRPTAYSNKQNSAGETVLVADNCGCQSPTFGRVYYCNAPGDYRSENTYPGTALDNINSSDKWAGGGVFCRDQCARFGSNYTCSARNSGCFCECDKNKVKCPVNYTADPVTCQCVPNQTRNGTNNTSGGAGGCGNGTPCCGSTSDLTCGGSCPPGQYCSVVGSNASGQNLSGRNLCQCVGPQLVDTPCNLTSDCNGYCGDAGSWCALSKNGACVCTRTPDTVHVDVSIIRTPVKVGDTGPIQAHVYWDDNTPASGSVTFVLGASSRTETLDSGGVAKVWGLCLSSGTTPARALYHGVEGSKPFECVD